MRNTRVEAFQMWAERLIDLKHKQAWITFTNKQLYDHFVDIHETIMYFLSSQTGLRSTYADFLEEASDIINNPQLRQVSSLYRNLGNKWTKLANTILPDSIPLFKDTVEVIKKSNTLFLNHNQSQINTWVEKHEKIKGIRSKVLESWPFSKNEIITFFKELNQQLLSIYKDEKEAIKALKSTIS